MRIAVYIRVSTLDQANGAKSQEHAINRYLKAHGLKAKFA
jgi:DNA invertase Pin-like site-specific DNA recombinase